MNDRNLTPSFTLLESDARYFDKIPAPYLVPLKLLHHEKMNFKEIAQQTGLPGGTVRSRVHRARAIIRQMRAQDAARQEIWQAPTMGVVA